MPFVINKSIKVYKASFLIKKKKKSPLILVLNRKQFEFY